MISVMGATGHTGKRIAELLLKAGEGVRAIARNEAKLSELRAAGAEVRSGDASDAAFLTSAFEGSEAVYTLLPPDPQSPDYREAQDRQGEAIASALRASGVRHVVFLSSVGADLASGTGPIAGLHVQEGRLRAIAGAHVLMLRPGYFFENFEAKLGSIEHQGLVADSIAPDVALPMVATRDIAAAAAQALRARDWKGPVVRELLGPRDLTHAEATRLLGERLGRPGLPYVQVPYADMAQTLVQFGLSDSFAGLYVEMTRAFNEGRVRSREGRRPENSTPTRFEDFCEELAGAPQPSW